MRQCTPYGTAWSEAIRSRVEPRLEDRLHDLLHRRLDRSVFHSGNAERPKDARFTGFGNQNPTHRTRVKRPAPKFLADCDEIFFRSLLHDPSHRDPVYSRSPRAAISRYTIEGDTKIPWVGYKTPQFLEPIVRII